MLAILYLAICLIIGNAIIRRFLPLHTYSFFSHSDQSLSGKKKPFYKMIILIPASALTGMLFTTWALYVACWCFKDSSNPMLYGNITIFVLVFILLLIWIVLLLIAYVKKTKNRTGKTGLRSLTEQFIKNCTLRLSDSAISFKNIFIHNKLEIFAFFSFLAVWICLIFRSFNITGNSINIGPSVFSDFAPHLAVIRSFSYGSNFPTMYPHFPDGTIRYHFFFQFLAGNLEFLGLRLDWAFNLPSLIAMFSFIMLLFSLAFIISGKRAIGILTLVLFMFRSSFAFFTYAYGKSSISILINSILQNTLHIGNTLHEEWGLWAQKVYVNQRHFSFGLGILLIAVIAFIPLFEKLSEKREILLFKIDGWQIEKPARAVLLGLLIGLGGYWNGAVVIATFVILFFLAVFSAHRLEYLVSAALAGILVLLQSAFFTDGQYSVVNPEIYIGFLSGSDRFVDIASYFIELLGILPFIIVIVVVMNNPERRLQKIFIVFPVMVVLLFVTTPKVPLLYKYIFLLTLTTVLFIMIHLEIPAIMKNTGKITLAFFSPLLLASFLKLTPDVTVNHKYVMIAAILCGIPIAALVFAIGNAGRYSGKIISIVLVGFLTITGIVDLITLYNLDRNPIRIDRNDPLTVWAKEHSGSKDIFLTEVYSLHPLLLSGRMIFYGWPYYAWSAGYDTDVRKEIVSNIYGGEDLSVIKQLLDENGIDYVVIDDNNRRSESYHLNELIFEQNFEKVFEMVRDNLIVYQVNK